MVETHGIIFTGMERTNNISRPAGAARMRTFLGEHGYNIEVIDYFGEFTLEELKQVYDKYISKKTLFIGASITFLYSFEKMSEMFRYVKDKYPWVKVLLGGNETAMIGLDFSTVDNILWGYSEQAMLHYVKFLSKKLLNDLPWVPYKGTKSIDAERLYTNDTNDLTIKWLHSDGIKNNFLPIEISRGCIFKCAFCSYKLNGKKKLDYLRNAKLVAEELMDNYNRFGITKYYFLDDTFNDSNSKLEALHSEITKLPFKIEFWTYLRADLLARYPEQMKLMKEMGLRHAFFGIETFNNDPRINDIVVVTHTAPLRRFRYVPSNMDARHLGRSGNSLMQTVLMANTNKKIKAWCFGHYHNPVDMDVAGIRYVSNPRGRGDTPHHQTVYYPKRITVKY